MLFPQAKQLLANMQCSLERKIFLLLKKFSKRVVGCFDPALQVHMIL